MTKLKTESPTGTVPTRVMELLSRETVAGLRVIAYRATKETN